MTLTLSDVDPETFLTGHVDNWIEDVMAKNRGIQIVKKGMTEDGQVVEVIGSKIDIPRWKEAKQEIRELLRANGAEL